MHDHCPNVARREEVLDSDGESGAYFSLQQSGFSVALAGKSSLERSSSLVLVIGGLRHRIQTQQEEEMYLGPRNCGLRRAILEFGHDSSLRTEVCPGRGAQEGFHACQRR